MMKFLIRRIGTSIALLFLIVTLIFFSIHLVPGDPAVILLSVSGGNPSPQAVDNLRHLLGLDLPIYTQYFDFLKGILTGDLNQSFRGGFDVADAIFHRFPRSLEIIVLGSLFAVIIGSALGILGGTKKGAVDNFVTGLSSLGISVPVFVTSVLLIYIFSLKLDWFPAGGYKNWTHPLEHIRSIILPSIALSLPFVANVARMMRSSIVDFKKRDWVRTAVAFGFPPGVIFRRHVLRNAINPVITVVGLQFGKLFGSTVLVEQVFNYPGLSSLLLNGVSHRDYPVVQGIVLVIAAIFIVINLLVDIIYGLLDPRIAR